MKNISVKADCSLSDVSQDPSHLAAWFTTNRDRHHAQWETHTMENRLLSWHIASLYYSYFAWLKISFIQYQNMLNMFILNTRSWLDMFQIDVVFDILPIIMLLVRNLHVRGLQNTTTLLKTFWPCILFWRQKNFTRRCHHFFCL